MGNMKILSKYMRPSFAHDLWQRMKIGCVQSTAMVDSGQYINGCCEFDIRKIYRVMNV